MRTGPAPTISRSPQLTVDPAWKLRSSTGRPALPASHALGSVLLHGLFVAGLMTVPLDRPEIAQIILPFEFAIEIAAAPAATSNRITGLPPAITQTESSAPPASPVLSPPEKPISDLPPPETSSATAFQAMPVGRPSEKRRPIKQAIQTARLGSPAESIEAAPTASELPTLSSAPQLSTALSEPATPVADFVQWPAAGSGAAQTLAAAGQTEIPVIQQARFRRQPRPPQYPARARALDQQGTCIVRALIDLSGSSREVLLWRSSGFELLDQAALAAVRGWAFDAARQNDEPILAWVEIPVRFEIR